MGSNQVINALISRTFEENLAFIEQDPLQEYLYHVRIGFVPNMKVILLKILRIIELIFIGSW